MTLDAQRLVPGFSVNAVDTTAAGDAFNGRLAVALAQGRPLVGAVRFANACGALATTRRGAQPSLPTIDEVESFLAERGGQWVDLPAQRSVSTHTWTAQVKTSTTPCWSLANAYIEFLTASKDLPRIAHTVPTVPSILTW